MKHRHLFLSIAMVSAFAASAHATILNFTTFNGTETTADGNLAGFGDNGSSSFDTVNGWTWGTDFALAGGPGSATGVFAGLPDFGPVGAIDDAEIRVGAGLELETAGAGAFFFGFGNNTNGNVALAQQFNGVGVGQTVTVDYVLSAFADMRLYVDDGSGTFVNAGALDGSFDFITTGSGNIRIALTANNTGDTNTRLDSIQVSAVPEPSTYGLMGAGALAGVAFVRRRRKHAGEIDA